MTDDLVTRAKMVHIHDRHTKGPEGLYGESVVERVIEWFDRELVLLSVDHPLYNYTQNMKNTLIPHLESLCSWKRLSLAMTEPKKKHPLEGFVPGGCGGVNE